MRVSLRGSSLRGTESRAPTKPAIRINRGRKVERILLDAKLHVITQFRQAQQTARVASLAKRVGQVVPDLEKSVPDDGGRIGESHPRD